jgi:hemerythrin
MAKIEWDNNLSIGIDQIDDQHKMLIQRLSDLSEAIEAQQGEGQAMKTLDFMIEYTHFHFSSEEEYMAQQNYPGLEHQQAQHNEFKNMLKQMIQELEEEGPTRALTTSINTFLLNWLTNHIKGVDLKIAEFIKDKDSSQ